MNGSSNKRWICLIYVLAGIQLAAAIVPFLYQYVAAAGAYQEVIPAFGNARVLTALWLSFLSAFVTLALALLLGVPLGYFFARRNFFGKAFVETLAVDVPQTFPPIAEGMIFLLMLGPDSPFHVNLAYTFTALVIAKFYISAPFVVSYSARRFREIEKTGVNLTARTLGANPFQVFLTIFLPLGLKDIGAGAALCWSRAMGELGGSLLFAGVIVSKTEIIPTFIATQAQTLTALALAATILVTSASTIALTTFKYLSRKS
jgi:molybdate transport system permease protein